MRPETIEIEPVEIGGLAGFHTPWLAYDQAQAYLQVTRRTLDRWRADGRLRAYRVGPREVRFRVEDLNALVEPIPAGAA